MIEKNYKISVIQPAIPDYRIFLFSGLYKKFKFLKVYSSTGYDENKFEIPRFPWVIETGKVVRIFKYFLWQKNIPNNIYKNSDIIIIWGNLRLLNNIKIIIMSKFYNKKIIWWGQLPIKNRLTNYLRMFFLKSCNAFICYNYSEIQNWPYSLKKLKYFYHNNTVDTKKIINYRNLYSSQNRQSITFMGRLTKKSYIEYFIKLSEEKQFSKIKFEIIGDGDQHSVIKKNLETKKNHNFFYHGAIYDEENIAKILNRTKIFIYPGQVGLSLLHAMSYGLPCIVGKFKHNYPEVESLEENKNGFFFKGTDYNDLLSKVAKLNKSDSLCNQFSNESINIINNKYKSEFTLSNFEKIINSTM